MLSREAGSSGTVRGINHGTAAHIAKEACAAPQLVDDRSMAPAGLLEMLGIEEGRVNLVTNTNHCDEVSTPHRSDWYW
jgi:hypothetical protein